MIDVLVPVLHRPRAVEPFITSLRENSQHVSSIFFLCNEGDSAEIAAIEALDEVAIVLPWQPLAGDYARKMNHGFSCTSSEFVFLGADDITFTPDWDVNALRAADGGAGVIATNDCANPQVKKGEFGTHCLVRRSYVEILGGSLEGPGHLLSEAYDHNFCDRELCHIADRRNLYVFAADSHVPHHHPHFDSTVKPDATYRKGQRHFREDRRLFLRRMNGLLT